MSAETLLALGVSYVGNPLSMWLAIKRKPFGWWLVAVTQFAFVAFAATSGDWRFGGQVLCLGMACYGVYLWQIRREHEPAIGRSARAEQTLPADVPPSASAHWNELQQLHADSARRLQTNLARPVFPADLVRRATARIDPATLDVLAVAQDALAELNHHDHQRAAELRERLEVARAD
jgi:hypothetical protein